LTILQPQKKIAKKKALTQLWTEKPKAKIEKENEMEQLVQPPSVSRPTKESTGHYPLLCTRISIGKNETNRLSD
jgi:hypothetical protein